MALGAFLIGSIPFGLIIGRIFYRTDIRSQGSGNIGAMNALRTLGKGGAVAVLLLDALKGFVPTMLVVWLLRHGYDFDIEGLPPGDQLLGSLVAMAAVLGHCFSPWLRLRGGKGVATSFGAIFALCWPAGLIAVGGWLLGALLTRYSSVGSLLGSVVAPIAIWSFTASPIETLYGVLAALLIFFTHRQNIARLRAGTEGPIRPIKRGA
ncbi:MAG: glycerol-3-phosphate 1-O-acyltransferase PlsY [Candidatus Eremiobacteraeota bacterium]|nr:glycerol-3-phosphate 1-O-acyltransferase PlsY [Candidatus Eremiobacteraeota bacterium]